MEVICESQLVLVCQDACDSVPNKFGRYDHFNLNLPCMQLPFVTNFGVKKTISDKIIILESDRILPAGYFAEVLKELRSGVQITCRNMKKLQKPATDDEIIAGTFESVDEYRSESNNIGMRNMWSGNTAIWKEDFYRAGCMDEAYHGYGWADSDMTNRMESAGVKSIFRSELELHLWHPPATYGAGDQKQMFINNGLRFCKIWGKPLPDWFRKEIAQHKKVLL